ncbi:MAG: gluconate 2-dehydrogenase subunit 3 family protein [Pseudomonadota bacterium]
MNRRDFLQAAAILVAGNSVLPPGIALSQEQSAFLAAQPSYIDQHELTFFSKGQRNAITTASEVIIPRTDTPGAIDAGTPRFIELLVSDWFTDEERAPFMAGLADLLERAGGDFAALAPAGQLALFEALEEEASDSSWYSLGNIFRVWDFEAPFICQLKELTVLGFFLSKVGATQVLRDNPMGRFDGDVPLGPDDASYNASPTLPTRKYFYQVTDRS